MNSDIVEIFEEIDQPKKERIWFSILGVLSFYVVILIFSNFVLGKIVSSEILSSKPYLYTINLFVILMIYFFIIVFLLRIPDNNISILQYLKKLKLLKIKSFLIILGLGVIVGVVFLLFLLLSSYVSAVLISGELVLDFRLFWVSFDYSNFLYQALIPGIWEEVAFRGIVLVLLMKKYSKKKSIIINSIVFGLFHLINLVNMWGGSYPLNVLTNVAFQVVYATAAGFVFAYLYVKTESLVPSILSHYLLDAFGPFIQVIVLSGGYTLAELAIVRTSQTILGIGFIPSIVNIIIIYLVYKLWKKEPFLEIVEITGEVQEKEQVDGVFNT